MAGPAAARRDARARNRCSFTVLGCALLFTVLCGCAAQTHGGVASRDFAALWSHYKNLFISADGRLTDSFHRISHSEGQGTAMLFAVAAGDREVFERVWRWTRDQLQRPDRLFAWRWDARASPPISDYNNAADGDVLIAWALFRAYQKWGEQSFLEDARAVCAAIRNQLLVRLAGRTVLMPGSMYFADDDRLTFNPSYFVLPAFAVFARYDEASLWRTVYTDSVALIRDTGATTLPVPLDWMSLDHDGNIGISSKHEPVSGYDAIRIPLYLAWCGQRDELEPFKAFWQRHGGWRAAPSWINITSGERPDYAPEPGILAIRALAHGERYHPDLKGPDAENYYSLSLVMFTLLAHESGHCARGE